jgi:hypothetical protein
MNESNLNSSLNIHSDNYSMSVDEVINIIQDDEINIPDSVRCGEGWSAEQQKLYIESMLLGFPVSSFIVVQDNNRIWKVVDGVKRFKALIGFLNDDFKVIPPVISSSENPSSEITYSNFSLKNQRYVKRILFHFFIHTFDNPKDSAKFEERIHADFDVLARKLIIIDRYLTFENDSYLEALTLISTFNSHLLEKYPETNITVKIEQEGDRIRLIVEAEDGVHVETEQILNDFNKSIFRKLQNIEDIKEQGLKNINKPTTNVLINLKNENTITNNVSVNIEFKSLINKNNGLINELIEELQSTPEIVNQLKKIISSSESVTQPEQLESSAFLSRATRFAEQAKEKGSALYKLTKTSKECADIVSKIIDNLQLFSSLF